MRTTQLPSAPRPRVVGTLSNGRAKSVNTLRSCGPARGKRYNRACNAYTAPSYKVSTKILTSDRHRRWTTRVVFAEMNRMQRNPAALATQEFDVLVIGAGAFGAAAARDAALRGL